MRPRSNIRRATVSAAYTVTSRVTRHVKTLPTPVNERRFHVTSYVKRENFTFTSYVKRENCTLYYT